MSRATKPSWVNGAEAAAPGANSQLVKVVTTAGRAGKVYGARICSQEANAAGKVWRIRASIQGTTVIVFSLDVLSPLFVSDYPLFIMKGNGVDFYEIINVVAGTASTLHQASLLYDEEELDAPERMND
jgi:hypothetical protein